MKKYFFIAIAAVGLFSACSSHDEDFDATENPGGDLFTDELMPIKLSFGAPEATRGTGTVGGGFKDIRNNQEDNVWAGQNVTIFMTNKKGLDAATFNGTPIFNHEDFYAPAAADMVDNGLAYPVNDLVKYYPTTGAFDFWGYRLDDAVKAAPVVNEADKTVSINFTIDGSQDVMVAKAIPESQDTTDVIAYSTVNGSTLTESQAGTRIYSAYAARGGVQPNLKFRHLLSRLKFYVKAGQYEAKDINIDSIKVISLTTGDLVVAHLDNDTTFQRITWDETSKDSLVLKQRDALAANPKNANLVELDPVKPVITEDDKNLWTREDVDTVAVGEALLVAPGVRNAEDANDDRYNIVIFMSQDTKIQYNPEDPEANTKKEFFSNISKAISRELEAGKSYNVLITVYGLSEIDVTTTLVPWEDGEGFVIVPEDEGFENEEDEAEEEEEPTPVPNPEPNPEP